MPSNEPILWKYRQPNCADFFMVGLIIIWYKCTPSLSHWSIFNVDLKFLFWAVKQHIYEQKQKVDHTASKKMSCNSDGSLNPRYGLQGVHFKQLHAKSR